MFLHVKFRIFFSVIICYYGSVNIGCKECGIEWWMLEEIKYLHSQSLTVDLKSCRNQSCRGTCGIWWTDKEWPKWDKAIGFACLVCCGLHEVKWVQSWWVFSLKKSHQVLICTGTWRSRVGTVAVFVFGQYFDSLNKLGCQSWYSWVHKKKANLKAVYKLCSPSVDPNAMPLNRVRQRGGQHIS